MAGKEQAVVSARHLGARQPKCVLVFVDAAIDVTPLVRQAINEAKRRNARLIALGVKPAKEKYGLQEISRYERNLELAQNLGARVFEITPREGGQALAKISAEYQVIKIYQGNWWAKRFNRRRDKLDNLLKFFPASRIEMVETEYLEKRESDFNSGTFKSRPSDYIVSIRIIALITFLGWLVGHAVELYVFLEISYNILISYLMVISYIAFRFGILQAVLSSVISFFAYSYFFVVPIFRFSVDGQIELLNLFFFLFAALSASAAGNILRERTNRLKIREGRTEALFYFNRNVAFADTYKQLIETVGRSLSDMLDIQILIALPDINNKKQIRVIYPRDFRPEQHGEMLSAMKMAWEKEIFTGKHTQHFPEAGCCWMLMATALKKIGLIGYCGREERLLSDHRRFISALTNQAAIAIERMQMLEVSRHALIAEEREKLRSALLSSVSHDLKTPLASIIGSLSVVTQMGGSISMEDREELKKNALEEAERLHSFINNILSMSKMESGKVEVNRKWISADELVRETLKKLGNIQNTHRIQLEPSLRQYRFKVDIRLMMQVIQNLIDNAAKYSPPDSTITVGCEPDGKKLALFVSDEGKGIPTDEIPRIFDKFNRLEKKDSKIAGTGLGLSIVKTLMRAHRGTVRVVNNQERQRDARGVTFMLGFAFRDVQLINLVDEKTI